MDVKDKEKNYFSALYDIAQIVTHKYRLDNKK
jgi:hypothetical protein